MYVDWAGDGSIHNVAEPLHVWTRSEYHHYYYFFICP